MGLTEDWPRADQASHFWPGLVVKVCSSLSPRESAAAVTNACSLVRYDTVSIHLTAGVVCVGLFGSHNPTKIWHPHGLCHKTIPHRDGAMKIGLSKVVGAVKDLMPPNQAGSTTITEMKP